MFIKYSQLCIYKVNREAPQPASLMPTLTCTVRVHIELCDFLIDMVVVIWGCNVFIIKTLEIVCKSLENQTDELSAAGQ